MLHPRCSCTIASEETFANIVRVGFELPSFYRSGLWLFSIFERSSSSALCDICLVHPSGDLTTFATHSSGKKAERTETDSAFPSYRKPITVIALEVHAPFAARHPWSLRSWVCSFIPSAAVSQ